MRSFLGFRRLERNHVSWGLNVRNVESCFSLRGRSAWKCFAEDMEEIPLSQGRKVYSYTIVHHATPGYTGPLPYAVGAVQPFREGLLFLSPLTQYPLDQLKIGMHVELVLEKLCEDENGNEVISYKFRPLSLLPLPTGERGRVRGFGVWNLKWSRTVWSRLCRVRSTENG